MLDLRDVARSERCSARSSLKNDNYHWTKLNMNATRRDFLGRAAAATLLTSVPGWAMGRSSSSKLEQICVQFLAVSKLFRYASDA